MTANQRSVKLAGLCKKKNKKKDPESCILPCHGKRQTDRLACSVCQQENRSVSSPPVEPPCSHLRGTTASLSVEMSELPGSNNKQTKHRRFNLHARWNDFTNAQCFL